MIRKTRVVHYDGRYAVQIKGIWLWRYIRNTWSCRSDHPVYTFATPEHAFEFAKDWIAKLDKKDEDVMMTGKVVGYYESGE